MEIQDLINLNFLDVSPFKMSVSVLRSILFINLVYGLPYTELMVLA